MRGILLAALLLLATLAPAFARMHSPYRAHRILPAAAPPLDGFTAPSGAYSFRKLRTAYAGPAVRLRRASDNLEVDIGFLGFTSFTGAPWNEAAALTHCNATTCFVRWWYDQSGLARDIGEATAANQPQLIFNCKGSLPCVRAVGKVLQTVSATLTPVSPLTFAAVGNRSAGVDVCYWPITYNSFNLLAATNGGPNSWTVAGSGSIAATAADNVWHSGVGVINAAASVLRIDGVETTGAVTVATAVGAYIGFWSAAAATCNAAEVISWDNYAMTPAERAVLGNNQKSFWGTP